MVRISPRWRWVVYWVVFTAALTTFGWAVYDVLSWPVVVILALLAAPATAVIIWREEQQQTRKSP
jgi:hypothetical protein